MSPSQAVVLPWFGELPDLPQALCQYLDPEIFFEPYGTGSGRKPKGWRDRSADARYACSGCPERLKCLEFALAHPEVQGIWAGTSVVQRSARRKQQRSVAS